VAATLIGAATLVMVVEFAASAGRGPARTGASAIGAGWAAATATAGRRAAASATAAAVDPGWVGLIAPRRVSNRIAPAMAPTRTAATHWTGPRPPMVGAVFWPRRASAASAAELEPEQPAEGGEDGEDVVVGPGVGDRGDDIAEAGQVPGDAPAEPGQWPPDDLDQQPWHTGDETAEDRERGQGAQQPPDGGQGSNHDHCLLPVLTLRCSGR
jgi:hypothetical protein